MTKIAKEIEIEIHFHNYKLLKEKSFVLNGSFIYFIQGPNKVGKTTFLKALSSLQTASDDTPLKVTKGESEGYYEATLPTSDGKMVTIRHTFAENAKGKFVAIREDGTKISSVTEIRSLFNYTPINVSEFFALSKTAEGRRRQRDIILKLLPDTVRAEFNDLSLREEHKYSQRTEANKLKDQATINVEAIILNPEEQKFLSKEKEADELILKYEGALDIKYGIDTLEKELKVADEDVVRLKKELKIALDLVNVTEKKIRANEKALGELLDVSVETISEKVATGREIKDKITASKTKINLKEGFEKQYTDFNKQSKILDKEIEELRTKKQEIVSKSDLPVKDISFQDDVLTIDGFQFKENQVCESDAVLILANILSKINPSPIQIIGDASILDNEKLEALAEIAEKNNKVMFVDEVIRDSSDMVVAGYEEITKADFDKTMKGIASKSTKKVQPKSDHNVQIVNQKEIKEKLSDESGQVEKESKPSGDESDDKVEPLF